MPKFWRTISPFWPKLLFFKAQLACFEKSKCSLWLVYTGTTVTLQNDAIDALLFSFALVGGHKILNYFWLVERIVPPQKVVFFLLSFFLKWNWDRNGCLKDQPYITSAKNWMGGSRKLPVCWRSVLYLCYFNSFSGWVRKSPKLCWRNIWMVPNAISWYRFVVIPMNQNGHTINHSKISAKCMWHP